MENFSSLDSATYQFLGDSSTQYAKNSRIYISKSDYTSKIDYLLDIYSLIPNRHLKSTELVVFSFQSGPQ